MTTERDYFNPDPAWHEHVRGYERLIAKIAQKLCDDEFTQDDLKQDARIALLRVRPEQVRAANGPDLSDTQRNAALKAYAGNLIRNVMLKTLTRGGTANDYVGRTRRRREKNGTLRTSYTPARLLSYDELAEVGFQVDTAYGISWQMHEGDDSGKQQELAYRQAVRDALRDEDA